MAREYFKLIPAVYIILRRGGEVLLLRRAHTGYNDGNYSLPAGHHDGGESLIQAACREAKEEVGVVLSPEDLQFVHVAHRQGDDGERLDFYFAAKAFQGEPTNCEPEKCDDVRWFSLGQLPENMSVSVRTALEHYAKNEFYNETDWR